MLALRATIAHKEGLVGVGHRFGRCSRCSATMLPILEAFAILIRVGRVAVLVLHLTTGAAAAARVAAGTAGHVIAAGTRGIAGGALLIYHTGRCCKFGNGTAAQMRMRLESWQVGVVCLLLLLRLLLLQWQVMVLLRGKVLLLCMVMLLLLLLLLLLQLVRLRGRVEGCAGTQIQDSMCCMQVLLRRSPSPIPVRRLVIQ